MFIFGILATWKCDFCLFGNGSFYVYDFGYTCVGIRNNCKYHLLLHVNSDCKIRNTRIQYLMSCVSMSNDESLKYVTVSFVFHNVLFRHFIWVKMRFLFIRQRDLLSQTFWMHFCWDKKYLERPPLFSIWTQIARVVIHEYHI